MFEGFRTRLCLRHARTSHAQRFRRDLTAVRIVIDEDDLTTDLLVDRVFELYCNRQNYHDAMSRSGQMDSIRTIMKLLEEVQEN